MSDRRRCGSGGATRAAAIQDYTLPAQEGEVVLDVIHRIQATRHPTSPAAGTARPASAVPARPRSTASRGSCA